MEMQDYTHWQKKAGNAESKFTINTATLYSLNSLYI